MQCTQSPLLNWSGPVLLTMQRCVHSMFALSSVSQAVELAHVLRPLSPSTKSIFSTYRSTEVCCYDCYLALPVSSVIASWFCCNIAHLQLGHCSGYNCSSGVLSLLTLLGCSSFLQTWLSRQIYFVLCAVHKVRFDAAGNLLMLHRSKNWCQRAGSWAFRFLLTAHLDLAY